MDNVPQRTCLMCARELPVGSSQSRRYCEECGKRRNNELTKERQRKKKKLAEEQRKIRADLEQKRYCRECVYSGVTGYCEYILLTGHRRGCKAGEGCEKRRVE